MKEMTQILLTDKETPAFSYDLKTFSFDDGDEVRHFAFLLHLLILFQVYAIAVHNPLGWIRRKYIKVRVTIPNVMVTTYDGVTVGGAQVRF